MGLLEETKRILMAHEVRLRRRLGQNFLVDEGILKKLVSYASVNDDDIILEVGAGLGFLTEHLARIAKQVIAVEIDPKIVRILMHRLSNYRNVVILRGDILKISNLPYFNKVVSIPPYSISSPLIFWLLRRRFDCAVLTFQEEFGRRLVAQPGTGDYGRLTVTVYYYADVDLLDFIPRESFWPMPEVNSVIVRLRPRKPPFYVKDEEQFFRFLRAVFTQKNKKVRSAIKVFLSDLKFPKEIMYNVADSIAFHERRVRELSPEELALIFNELYEKVIVSGKVKKVP
ncbi:MAG: 16S rRNA (adenine(1518)-N(6)/adenine(1519)-N(6))-dimethyltransferase RsmA [Candidatus Bathyarchaeia archaeon]|nr:ribosomal RNA small subunit methyltransferase A [Candidatus Bathyarchaeota archaeon]